MTLQQYLKDRGRGSLTELAKTVGTSKGYLHDLVNNRRERPSVDLAQRIEEATDGAVRAVVLLGLEAA